MTLLLHINVRLSGSSPRFLRKTRPPLFVGVEPLLSWRSPSCSGATIRGRLDCMVSRKRRAAEAAVEAGAVPKPNGRPPTAYPNWDGERGCWVDDAGKERPSTLPATVCSRSSTSSPSGSR